jgi:hypothetical protein
VLDFQASFNSRVKDGVLTGGITPAEQSFIFDEIQLCKLDFRYWAERYCYISDDKGKMQPFRLRPSQVTLLDRFGELEEASQPLPPGKIALVLCKARRVGATVFGQAAVHHGAVLHSQAQALTASDVPENTLKIYQIQNRIFDNLPLWMRPVIDGNVKADHMRFPNLDSDLVFGTGNQKNPLGQGVRLDYIHLTELGTWQFPDMIDDDMLPAFLSSGVPSSFIFLESTAKSDQSSGIWFEDQYRRAKEGKGVFRSAFLSWYNCPEIHTMPGAGVEFKENTLKVAERIKRDGGYECTRDQLAWYQVTREQFESKGKLQNFLAEYPSSDDEAFQSGFRSVIKLETRDRIRQEIREPLLVFKWDRLAKRFVEEKDRTPDSPRLNRLFLWEMPKKGYVYIVAVDGSHGRGDDDTDGDSSDPGGNDRSAVEVVRLGNRNRPAEQVAQFVGYLRPKELALPVEKLGRMYGDKTNEGFPAKLAIEVNIGSPSAETQDVLLQRGYPNFYIYRRPAKVGGGMTNDIGWYTTPNTRGWITEGLVADIEDGTLLINSLITLDEMRTFVNVPKPTQPRHLQHAPGYHDDSLLALAIAAFVGKEPGAMMDTANAERTGLTIPLTAQRAVWNPQAMVDFPDGTVITSENYWEYGEHDLR